MLKRALGALFSLVLAGGCTTHLESGTARADDPASRRGIAYFLPYTQFAVKTTWIVGKCNDSGPELVAKVEATPGSAPDPEGLQVIDYGSLDAWTKTSAVKVDFYDSGAIKSINASADDRTGEIAGSVISAVGKLGAFAVGSTGVGVTNGCSADVNNALTALGAAKTDIGKLTVELKTAEDALDILTAGVVRKGSNPGEDALAALNKQIDLVSAKKLELQAAQKRLARELKALTHTDESTFPETSSQLAGGPIAIPAEVFADWLRDDFKGSAASKSAANAVYLKLALAGGLGTGSNYENGGFSEKDSRRAGIRYRVAVPATLSACKGGACGVPDALGDLPKIVAALPVRVLQRGSTFYLPFKSEPFSNGGLIATFSEAGVLTSAGYDQKRAQGEAAAAVFEKLVGQGIAVGTAIRGKADEEVALLQDQTALAKVQKELAVAQKEQAAAQAALQRSPLADVQDQLAALTAENALKNANIASLQADLALEKARAELSAARAAAGGSW
ncbi:MAG: hypothetical protein ACREUQ_14755 [Burkholderiales bacterium]